MFGVRSSSAMLRYRSSTLTSSWWLKVMEQSGRCTMQRLESCELCSGQPSGHNIPPARNRSSKHIQSHTASRTTHTGGRARAGGPAAVWCASTACARGRSNEPPFLLRATRFPFQSNIQPWGYNVRFIWLRTKGQEGSELEEQGAEWQPPRLVLGRNVPHPQAVLDDINELRCWQGQLAGLVDLTDTVDVPVMSSAAAVWLSRADELGVLRLYGRAWLYGRCGAAAETPVGVHFCCPLAFMISTDSERPK
jgi:hypothetical protein